MCVGGPFYAPAGAIQNTLPPLSGLVELLFVFLALVLGSVVLLPFLSMWSAAAFLLAFEFERHCVLTFPPPNLA